MYFVLCLKTIRPMKKIIFLSTILSLCILLAGAQARQGTVEYNKQQVPCYVIPYSYSKSITEDAIKDRMKAMGLKGDNKKGFMEYNNVMLPEISSSPVDAKFKVEKGGSDNTSMVYMIVNPAGSSNTQPIAGAATTDYSTGASTFLSNMGASTGDYSLEQDIKKQEDEVKKAEKKQNNLIDDGNDMQKKLQRLQNDIEDNRKKQTDQVSEVQKQRDALTQLQARRRVKP